jgi:cytochrome c2
MHDKSGRILQAAALLAALLAVAALSEVLVEGTRWQRRAVDEAVALTGGDPNRGRSVIARIGCGACHEIPGVVNAAGRVGPTLNGFGSRAYIAGVVPNEPGHLVEWIVNPRSLSPRTAMPTLAVSPSDARDIAAFVYTLR